MIRLIGGTHDGEYHDPPPSFDRIQMIQKHPARHATWDKSGFDAPAAKTETYRRIRFACGIEFFVIDGMDEVAFLARLLEFYRP